MYARIIVFFIMFATASIVQAQSRPIPAAEIRDNIKRCWALSSDIKGNPQIVLHIKFRRDATLMAAPEVVSASDMPELMKKSLADALKKAVIDCQPFSMLLQSPYSSWKDMEFVFNLRDIETAPSTINVNPEPPSGNDRPTPEESAEELATAKREADVKGRQYADKRDTSWQLNKTINEMTDKTEWQATSLQGNGQGATAEVTAKCERPGVLVLDATVFDDSGKPTVALTGHGRNAFGFVVTDGMLRINDNAAHPDVFDASSFRNKFRFATLYTNEARDREAKLAACLIPNCSSQSYKDKVISNYRRNLTPIDGTWRILAEVSTTSGKVLIRVPIYDPSISEVTKSCH